MSDQKMMATAPVMPVPAAGAPVPPPSYYEAAAGYPPQPGYPPQQPGGYPPHQQGAYPPQQPGAYPPQQPGAYPPQQPGAYPPQQPGAYPPPQHGYAPSPSAPPQAGYGMAPQPGHGAYAPVPTMPMPAVVQPGTTVVVVQQAVHFRDHAVVATCPRCQQSVQTITSTQNGALTWLICVLLCFFCPIIFCLPFCIDGMKDVVHRCPNCRTRMGTYNRL